jgi:hypothetical protein
MCGTGPERTAKFDDQRTKVEGRTGQRDLLPKNFHLLFGGLGSPLELVLNVMPRIQVPYDLALRNTP